MTSLHKISELDLEVGTHQVHELMKRANIHPSSFQTATIITATIYFFAIFFLWHVPVLRDIIAGFKLFTVAVHEMFHIMVGMLVGGEVISICIDPNLGGETVIDRLLRHTPRPARNPVELYHRTYPQAFWSYKAVATLGAGYVGSSIVGFLFIFAAFDITASKIASFVIAAGLLIPALRVDSFIAFASIVAAEGLLIGMWFTDHGNGLRYYVLFLGVMNLFYSALDFTDEKLFDKVNSSDCSQFTNLLGWPASAWGAFWFLWSAGVFVAAIFAGICVWPRTSDQQIRNSHFLPT